MLIYGTGFSASEFVAPMRVFGAGGVELSEEWGGDAQAYLGMTVPGFPNFFLLYGPNTNLVINGSILIMVECQVRYAVEAIGRLLAGRPPDDVRAAATSTSATAARMQEGNARMVWGVADVPTWYRNAHGRVTQNWPFDLHTYWDRTGIPTWPTTSWPEADGAQPGADRDPRPRPAGLCRPRRGLPGRAGDDGAVPRAPGAGAGHGDRGGARRGALCLVRGRPASRDATGGVPLPRRRPRVVAARRLSLLRGHAGRTARGTACDGGLPACPRAPLSRRAPRLLAAYRGLLAAASTRAHLVVSGDSCGGLLGWARS